MKTIFEGRDGAVRVEPAGPIERWSIKLHRFETVDGFAVVVYGRAWRPWLDRDSALYLAEQLVADVDKLNAVVGRLITPRQKRASVAV